MKKAIAIVFILTYSLASFGITINLHYCNGRLVGQNFSHSKQGKCVVCGMRGNNVENGCCKYKHEWFKLKADQDLSTASFKVDKVSSEYATNIYSESADLQSPLIQKEKPISNSPPFRSVSIYIRDRVFRI